MNYKPDIEKLVKDTLESLEGIQPAEPRPFFYTRLMARMTKADKNLWGLLSATLSKPAVVIASLIIIFILNAFILFREENEPSPVATSIELNTDNEYILASSSSFEYENLEQQ